MAEKPILNQYYPGGVAQQALDWNIQEHESLALGSTDIVTEGDGFLQIGSVIQNWGVINFPGRESAPAQQVTFLPQPFGVITRVARFGFGLRDWVGGQLLSGILLDQLVQIEAPGGDPAQHGFIHKRAQ